jgi:multiple sugar transport system permease protein
MIKDGLGSNTYATLHIIPDQFTFSEYKSVLWQQSDYWYYFWNSVVLSLPIMLGSLVVSTLGAFGIAKFQFPGRKILLTCIIILMLIPYQAMLTPTLLIVKKLDILDSRAAIILPNIFAPFGTYLMYQFMNALPNEPIEAARVDGANIVQIFIKIILPQVTPGLAAFVILNLIDTWNMVEQPLIFLSSQFKYPLSVALSNYITESSSIVFVSGVVFIIPMFLIFLLSKDYLILGIKKSVVKVNE